MGSEWEEYQLGDIAKVQGGYAFKSKDFSNDGTIPVVKIKNVRKRDIDLSDVATVTKEIAEAASKFYVKNNDILISMTGSGPNAPASIVGRVARHSGKNNAFLINQRVGRFLIQHKRKLDQRYLYFFFSTEQIQLALLSIATGSANQVNISAKQIESTRIRLPPIEEQKSISHILGSLDDKIELNRQVNETLEAMAQALFKSWFIDFDPVIDNTLAAGSEIPQALAKKAAARKALGNTRKPLPENIQKHFPNSFQYTEEMGWIPEGWEATDFSNFSSLNPESWTKKNNPEKIKYVDLSNVKNGRIEQIVNYSFSEAPSRARRILKTHDTIIGTVRPGNRSFALISREGLTGSTGFAVLRPLNNSFRSFIYLGLTQNSVIDKFSHLADGAAYPAIRPDVVLNTTIIKPNSKTLSLFDELVYPKLQKISKRETQSITLSKLRDTLLPKLLSGELRIPDAEKLVEEAQ